MIRFTGRWLVSAAVPFVVGGAAAADGVGGPAPAAGIPNFGQVAEGIWRGGRPTREGLLRLKELGVRIIVNREQWTSDRSRAEGTGLKCLQWPCNAMSRPRDEEMAEILDVLCRADKSPVFIHCQYGADRTGCAVALYRILVQGWSVDRAEAEMHSFGFNPNCRRIAEYVEEFRSPGRIAQLRRLMTESPRPPASAEETAARPAQPGTRRQKA